MDDAVIIGFGFVGQATAKSLNIPWHFSLNDSNITLEEAAKKQFIIFCTPTPTNTKDAQEGVDIIDGYIQQLKEYGGRNIFIIRSTVLPGTCKHLAEKHDVMVVSNPEFLSEDTWEHDAVHPSQIVIGADDVPARIAVSNLWKKFKETRFIITDTVTSEMIKYSFNLFMLTKIIWANQIYDICQINGADYNTIKEMLYAHWWGTHHHLKPIHKGGRGGGGHCFPKDVKAFAKYSNLEFFKTIDKLNDEYLQASHKK
jgi:UDPglucose 6-dehydrogenase